MTTKNFLFVFLFLSINIFAQTVVLTEPISSLTSQEEYFTMPKISPDGEKVVFGGQSHTGLYLINFNGTGLLKLSEESAAGWNAKWAPTSEVVAVRVNNWSEDKRTKSSSIVVVQLDGSEENISGLKTSTSLPFWSDNGSILAWIENDSALNSIKLREDNTDILRYVNNNSLITKSEIDVMTSINENDATEKIFAPVEGEYLFVEWSPNGMRAAIQVIGKGIFVLDTQNNQLYDFGMGEYPDWINNDLLVCMDVKDDGHQILSSEVYVMNYDGRLVKNITEDFDEPALYPTASEDGKLVFQNLNGQIFKTVLSIQ